MKNENKRISDKNQSQEHFEVEGSLSNLEEEISNNKYPNNLKKEERIILDELEKEKILKQDYLNSKTIEETTSKVDGKNSNLLSNKRNRDNFEKYDYKSKNKDSINNENNDQKLNLNGKNTEEKKSSNLIFKNMECPYLGTIKRHLLDFDFEKVCSISLSNLNVYACLVCGKYYQGRGRNTHAYTHSLQEDHHIFINLNDEQIICLPEGYEVIDNSLKDIKLNLKPIYSEKEISEIDKDKEIEKIYSTALDGKEYIPGCIGLNNIKKTDYANVIIQALCRVTSLRDYFLKYDDSSANLKFELNALLIQRFSELIRKIWSPHNFKGHVSPHEFMQAITLASSNKFKIVEQSDSINFLSWFFNSIHEYLTKKNNSIKCKLFNHINLCIITYLLSGKKTYLKIKIYLKFIILILAIISETFQGKLLVETFTKVKGSNINELDNCSYVDIDGFVYKYEQKVQKFFFLTLDLPKAPLFKDSLENIVIPQISIFNLLKKYDGNTFTEDPIRGVKKRYHLLKLPKYLILYFKRFEKNNFFLEKNTTIINFPIKRLSLEEFTNEETKNSNLRYSLLANIIHDGKSNSGTFRSQIKHKILDKWFDIQDLNVNEILAPSVVVSESYIHVYEGNLD